MPNHRRRPRQPTRYRSRARARAAHRARTAAHRAPAAQHAPAAGPVDAPATDPVDPAAIAEAREARERMNRQLRERQAARVSAAVQNVLAAMDAADAAISDANAAVAVAALRLQAAPSDPTCQAAHYCATVYASNAVDEAGGAADAVDSAVSIAMDIRSKLDAGQQVGPELQDLDNAVDEVARCIKTARAAVDDAENAANTGTSEAGFSSLPPSPTPSDE